MLIKNRQAGFTIVELLIVIVVIGILVAIVVVAYTGITTQTNNTAKITELKSLAKLFDAYKAREGTYPRQELETSTSPTTNPAGNTYPVGYCLGSGYPNAGSPSEPSCYAMAATTSPYMYRENDTTANDIRSKLATIGKIPSPITNFRVFTVMGPVAFYYRNFIYLVTVIKGKTIYDCPGGTERHYPSDQTTMDSQDGRLECRIRLDK